MPDMPAEASQLEVAALSDGEPIDLAQLIRELDEARGRPREQGLQQAWQSLLHLNRSAVTLLERQRALQKLAEEFRHYDGACRDLPALAMPFARLSLDMAVGFKRLLLQLLQNRQPPTPHLAWCLHMAQQFLAQGLWRHYQAYREPPASLWKDSHLLYWIGERYGCLDEPVATAFQPRPSGSLRGLHQQCLLLALSNPFQLAEGEVERLFGALAPLAELARLLPWEMGDDDGPLLDLALAQPCLTPEQQPSVCVPSLRRLELGALLVALDDPAPLRTAAEAELLERVRTHWRGREQRRHARAEQSQRCQLLIGLPDIHAQLLEKRPLSCPAQMLDSSPGGARLLCRTEQADSMPVGQLVLLLLDSATAALGMVRWRHLNNQGLHLGLHYLKGLPRPAWLRRAPSAQTHPGIMQSTLVEGGWRHGLWLPNGQFGEGERLWLQLANVSNQKTLHLPPADLSSRSVSRHPLPPA